MYHLSVPDPNSRNAAIKSRKLNDAILMLKKHIGQQQLLFPARPPVLGE